VSTRRVEDANFDASADIVSRLGAELFTDSSQALLELVKNSYDADATEVRLEIDSVDAGGSGLLLLSDNGTGMTEKTIRDSWLRLSFSAKREQKRAGKKTKRKRTPLGDKGLGRLGAQLLGASLEIRTRPQGERLEHVVRFEFSDFAAGRSLTDVPIAWEEVSDPPGGSWPFRAKHGTIISITGLRDASTWADPAEVERVLSRLINPFAGIEAFDLSATIDGAQVELRHLSRNVRESALQRWEISYDKESINLDGFIRLPWFQVKDKEQNALLHNSLRADGGERLIAELQSRTSGISDFWISPASRPWLLELKRSIPIAQVAGLPRPDSDCGPFRMELDVVARDFDIAQAASLSVFSAAEDYRAWLEEQAGVRIYRDGFVVASGYDLLRLGAGFTKAGSFYSLRPANVLGYVAITAEGNPNLEETTDREGFRANSAFEQFDALLIYARDQINRVMTTAGRAGLNLAKEIQKESVGSVNPSPEGLAEDATTVAEAAVGAQAEVESATLGLGRVMDSSPAGLSKGDRKILSQARAALQSADSALENVKRIAPAAEGVAKDFDDLQDNFQDLYETIGLGLAAEGVAHEITHVIQRLGERARLARKELEAGDGAVGANLSILVEEVDAAAKSLRGQLRHLDPQLRRSRNRRRSVNLGEFVDELAAYHRPRLAESEIDLRVTKRRPGEAWVSPGRLAQVLDNLILNSEYWVQKGIEGGHADGWIQLDVAGKRVTISDSGAGVPDEMVDAVFQPYVSMKASGRGLGLFIARQLLGTDRGAIELKKTSDGRNAEFLVDLSGARKEDLQ
jgi:hypothetical protein